MGLARKAFSIATGGVVRYRSANQQTAHYAKKSYELQRKRARQAAWHSIGWSCSGPGTSMESGLQRSTVLLTRQAPAC
jgi:hypothetical protein